MTLEFKMPKLGESVTEGTIGRWLKQPGDALEQYEPMLEVTTDKVDTEVSSPINGKLLEILVAEGETVAVGTVIARLDDSNGVGDGVTDDAPAVAVDSQPAMSRGESAAAEAPAKASYISPVVARLAAEHDIDLKQVQGTGAGGRVTKKDIESFVASRKAGVSQAAPAPTTQAAVSDQPTAPVEEAQLQQTMEAGPRTIEEQLAPTAMPAAPQTPTTDHRSPTTDHRPPALAEGDELVPLSPMRRAIAEHMVKSKRTAPHVTTVMEADLSRIMAHRESNKRDFERQGVKLTFTPYFVQAVVAGLQQTPIVNATFSDDGIVMHNRINIGVAVAIPDGLIVPVIRDADDKSLLGLSRAVNDLAERARTRRLQPDDTQGGTFTITNHGVSGSLFAMPIIPQPQSAILGVGAIQKRPVVISENGLDAIAIRPMCYLSLTFDHRLIDGATADEFLMAVKRALESYR
jgi:pyruvate/2-oxoglutarate dehydrogenase complex dihydrolipoamide acyltransferase (E2) component